MDAAERRHQDGVAGMFPIEIVGIDALEEQAHQPARHADRATGDHHRDQLGAIGVVAEARHALFVVAQRLHDPPERRMSDPPHRPQNREDDDQREDVERRRRGKQRPLDVLQTVLTAGPPPSI